MPLYPLGISRRGDVPSVPRQAAGSVDVRWSVSGELACAFIDGPHQAVPPMLHATVLDAIHRRICVLPVRFGITVRDEAEIRDLLDDRCQEMLDHLSRLDRTCEMGVRIAPPATREDRPRACHGLQQAVPDATCSGDAASSKQWHPAAKDVGPPHYRGRRLAPVPCSPSRAQDAASSGQRSPLAYMEQRRSLYQRTDDDAERDRLATQELVEQLQGCYRQWRILPASPSHRIRMAFLVERDRVTAFQSRAESACSACREGRWMVLGPWPPYSFAEILS